MRCSRSITSGGEFNRSCLGIAAKVGDGDEQVERLVAGQQRTAMRPRFHRVEGVEQEAGEGRRRRTAARSHLARTNRASLARTSARWAGSTVSSTAADRDDIIQAIGTATFLAKRETALTSGSSSRSTSAEFEPQVGERVERPAAGNGMGEEDGVDPACARPGHDVDENAQVDLGLLGDTAQQLVIDALAAVARRLARVEGAARPGEAPHLLGDAVHVDGEADPAVADQRDPKLLLPHRAGKWQEAASMSSDARNLLDAPVIQLRSS